MHDSIKYHEKILHMYISDMGCYPNVIDCAQLFYH